MPIPTSDAPGFRAGATAREPALAQPFHWRDGHIAASLTGGDVLFTTRRGGVSAGPYSSLNLGAATGDDGAHVSTNRDRLAESTGVTWSRVCHGRQVHGARVRGRAEPPGAERPPAEEDGQVTALPDAAALVLVADCLPVMLVAEGAVAALHAGWRGLAAGILDAGVAAMRDSGARGRITAALGPCARGCCYEVGEEVHERLPDPGARTGERGLELAAVACARLAAAGVDEVHDVGLCTMCLPALFFSHRRDRGTTGRQAGVAWRAR